MELLELRKRTVSQQGDQRMNTFSRHAVVMTLGLASLAAEPGSALAQQSAGQRYPAAIQTPHDYPGTSGAPTVVWQHILVHPGADLIALHFVDLELGPGDQLLLSDAQGGQVQTLEGKGNSEAGDFWAPHIKGDTVLLTLIAAGSEGGRGFTLTEYLAGSSLGWFLLEWHQGRLNRARQIHDRTPESQPERAVMAFLLDEEDSSDRLLGQLPAEAACLAHMAEGERALRRGDGAGAIAGYQRSVSTAGPRYDWVKQAAAVRMEQLGADRAIDSTVRK
jgi:hypothetical protein